MYVVTRENTKGGPTSQQNVCVGEGGRNLTEGQTHCEVQSGCVQDERVRIMLVFKLEKDNREKWLP